MRAPKINGDRGLPATGRGLSPEEQTTPFVDDTRDQEVARYCRETVSRLYADSDFCAALDALRRCHENALQRVREGGHSRAAVWLLWEFPNEPQGFGEMLEGFLDYLVPLLAWLVVSKRMDRKTWEKIVFLGAGRTWKSLTGFPLRLRKMAEEIESLNRSNLYSPDLTFKENIPAANRLKTTFYRLPLVLKAYATWVDVWTRKLPRLTPRYAGRSSRGNGSILVCLSSLIHVITGGYRDAEVSDLLNAADVALNSAKGPRFHPQTLLDLRSRQKRRTTQA
jgi:hypothetical protein